MSVRGKHKERSEERAFGGEQAEKQKLHGSHRKVHKRGQRKERREENMQWGERTHPHMRQSRWEEIEHRRETTEEK
jgi:hypothetical protein